MQSKLLQKINKSRPGFDGQQKENIEDSPLPWRGRETLCNPDNPAFAEAQKDSPAFLKRNSRPAMS
jgi:hypothetical protein